VKLGISLPVFTDDPARPLGVAARAHALDIDGVFAPDHMFPPVFYPPSGPDRPALEVARRPRRHNESLAIRGIGSRGRLAGVLVGHGHRNPQGIADRALP